MLVVTGTAVVEPRDDVGHFVRMLIEEEMATHALDIPQELNAAAGPSKLLRVDKSLKSTCDFHRQSRTGSAIGARFRAGRRMAYEVHALLGKLGSFDGRGKIDTFSLERPGLNVGVNPHGSPSKGLR